MGYMYIMGIRKWYFNWLLIFVFMAICWPVVLYMMYKMCKYLNELH